MSWNEVLVRRSQIEQLEVKKRDAIWRLEEAALRYIGLSIGDRIIATRLGKEFERSVTGVWGGAVVKKSHAGGR